MSNEYPPDWNSRRQTIYERDEYTCQNCGASGGPFGNAELHAHHVVPKSRGGSHDISNLITLCDRCHRTVHNDNLHAPSASQQLQANTGSLNPDFIDFSDIILHETVELYPIAVDHIITTTDELLTSSIEPEGILELQNEIRIAIVRIFEYIEEIRTCETHRFPEELVTAVNELVEACENLLVEIIETFELNEQTIIDIVNQAVSCPKCGAPFDDSDSFCRGCGTEFAEFVPSCPDCNAEVGEEDEFCRNCGSELEEHEGDVLGIARLGSDWGEAIGKQLEEVNLAIDDFTEAQYHAEIQYSVCGNAQVRVLWDYCPSCGFPEGALRSPQGIECIVCGSEWTDRGVKNGILEMTVGERDMEYLSIEEWGEIGKQRFEDGRYHELLHPEEEDINEYEV